jgi:hypothetical protein
LASEKTLEKTLNFLGISEVIQGFLLVIIAPLQSENQRIDCPLDYLSEVVVKLPGKIFTHHSSLAQ